MQESRKAKHSITDFPSKMQNRKHKKKIKKHEHCCIISGEQQKRRRPKEKKKETLRQSAGYSELFMNSEKWIYCRIFYL